MIDALKDKRLVLEVVGDARSPVELPRQGVMTIGSAKSKADVLLEGADVADVHCAIGRIKGGGWALKDLGSPAGTMVNGERVQQRRLEVGDLLTVGSRRLRVVDPEQVLEKPPAPSERAAPEISTRAPISATQVAAQSLPQVRGYRLEKPLGRGGMGEVYLAVQESLDRKVALKVLSSKLSADADFVRRFQAEARAAAALNHPNVVTVHDVWEDSGRQFLAMEYMDKGNLETRVAREGRIPVKEVVDILCDTAKALVYAELRGVVHRDIKPANLMQNSVGTIKVADLGLATHLEAEATEADNKRIYGTPHFISPEQARGEKVDGRSDLYSLGATVYRLLSGRTPFEGATTRDILRGHFFEAPKPLRELAPDVPEELARIVHRLLEKKPDERFGSAGALLQEIERFRNATLHGAPAAVAPKKSSAGMWLGVGALAAVIAVAIVLSRGGGEPADPHLADPRGRRTPPVDVDVGDANPQTPGEPDDASAQAGDTDPSRTTTRPSDDDTALKLRETEAELALARLPADLPPAERVSELQRLAREFAGTTAGGRCAQEAEDLRQEIARSEAALTARERALNAAVAALREAGLQGGQPLPLGGALRAMLAVATPEAFADDPQYAARRKQVFNERIRAATDRARTALMDVEAMIGRGEFGRIDSTLRPWLVELDAPDMPADLSGGQLPELAELTEIKRRVQERIDNLEHVQSEYDARLAQADGLRLGGELRGAQGIEAELRTLALGSIEQRLNTLEGELKTAPAKTFARDLRGDIAAGRRALESLAAEYGQGNWRRKTVADPRSKTRANRDAVGASSEGLTLEVGSARELVPWSAFGGKPAELNQLFQMRLAREYTHEELLGIEALMRTAAVVQAVGEAAEMFVPDVQAVLTEDEAAAIVEGFELARAWAEASGATDALKREAQAAQVLASALRAYSAQEITVAVAGLERLCREHRQTLLFRCLSDGSALPSSPAPSNGGATQPSEPTDPAGDKPKNGDASGGEARENR